MVYYFESVLENFPTRTIYMGKDKHENEELIKHSPKTNIWFHVDNLSSAHLYLELLPDEDWENLSPELLEDIGQLTKKNSIQGNKRDNIVILYTPVSNLKKDGTMDIGTVSFKKPKMVKKVHIVTKINAIVNRLTKTKIEISTDEYIERRKAEIMNKERHKLSLQRQKREELKKEQERFKIEKYRKETMYDDLHTSENVNAEENQYNEDDWW